MATTATSFRVLPVSAISSEIIQRQRRNRFQLRRAQSVDVLYSESDPLNGVSVVIEAEQNSSVIIKEQTKVPLLTGKVVELELEKEKEKEEGGLAPLWDDGYGNRTVEDYFDGAKEMCKFDGGPPRWFCPVECGHPLKNSPTLMFLPGN